MRYKKEGKFIRDLSTNERFDPTNIRFGDRARTEADAGQPELYELLTGRTVAQPEVRKATDGLDVLLDEIRQEKVDEDTSNRIENLVQEARVYLPKRRQELSQLGPDGYYQQSFNNDPVMAAVEAENYLNSLGRLQGDVPMPVIRGNERTHTTYRADGLTGQELVVPFLDPGDRRQVVKTVYGREGVVPGLQHQSEPAMQSAMKLAGHDTRMHGDDGYGYADLAATKDGRTRNIDVMVRKEFGDKEHVPIYTSLIPIRNNGQEAYDYRGSGAANYVKQEVENRMSRDKVGPYTAVEGLVKDNMVGPKAPEKRMGKVLRNQTGVMSSGEEYDSLIMPGYTPEIMSRGRSISPQMVPTAPNTIQMMDLNMALDRLQSGAMDNADIKYVTNYGANRQGYERLQIKPEFEMSREAGVIDMTEAYPSTQQLLAEDEMRRRLVI